MKNSFQFIIIIIISLMAGLTSCEDYVDIELPDQHRKIVAYCFISPQDTMITARIFYSTPLYSSMSPNQQQNAQMITNATVILEHNGASVIIPYDSQQQQYLLPAEQFVITAGETYQLKVMVDGIPTVEAKTTVPRDIVNLESYQFTTLPSSNESGMEENRYLVETKWNDINSESNFYSIMINQQVTWNNGEMVQTESFQIYRNHLSDNGTDGEIMMHRAEIHSFFPPIINLVESGFRIYLLNCSREYFLYHRSIQNGAGSSDPFSEPSIVFSNIENGLGCFGSFNGSSAFIPL